MKPQSGTWKSGCWRDVTVGVAAAVVLSTAVAVLPAVAGDDAEMLARVEKLEADMQRVEALEKRVAEVCAQMDQLTAQITEYSVRQSAAAGKAESEDEDFWGDYWRDKARECH